MEVIEMLKSRAIAKLLKGIKKNTFPGVQRLPHKLTVEKLPLNVAPMNSSSEELKKEKIQRLAMEHAHTLALQQVRRTQFKR